MEEIKPGDTILISNYKKGLYNKIVPPAIRWFTGAEYHHSAVVGSLNGKPWIYEAVWNGFLPTISLDDFLSKVGKDYDIIHFKKPTDIALKDVYRRLHEIHGAPYDYGALIIWQVVYQSIRKITGKGRWFGARGPKAKNKVYCTEANAYVYGFTKWWTYDPKKLYDKLLEINGGVSRKHK